MTYRSGHGHPAFTPRFLGKSLCQTASRRTGGPPVGGPPKPSRSYTGCRSEGRSTLGVQTPPGNATVSHTAVDSTCESRFGVTVAPEVKGRHTAASAAIPSKKLEEPKWEIRTARRRVAWALARERGPTGPTVVSRVGLPPIPMKFEFRVLLDGKQE